MLEQLTVGLGARSYPIYVGAGVLAQSELLTPHLVGTEVAIITNEVVAPLYLERLEQSLPDRRVFAVTLPDGEAYKTLDTLGRIFDELAQQRCHRDATIIALGGGVVGDMAGLAAACYQRGVALIQIPTTLLAQVDAAVGGKTAVNHPLGKNLIGTFYQPRCVLTDVDTLATLPDRELRAGIAEVIKCTLIRDAAFFTWLEENMKALCGRDPAVLIPTIIKCCQHKADIVAEDERETGSIRALLNLGHTFAHALETATGYRRWLHGEAVALGLVLAAELSCRRGWLASEDCERLRVLLEAAGLPVSVTGLDANAVLDIMHMDKKVRQGKLRLVLLRGIGEAVLVDDCSMDELHGLLTESFTSG